MSALIILAHGSRRTESNQEIVELAKKVAGLKDNQYDHVSYAYLEVVEPDLLQAIDKIFEQSGSDITVMPYFLNSGNHVTRDIPNMLNTAQEKYPDCNFKLAPCIGMHEDMPSLVLEQTKKL